ncbi:MAG: hypothetical protein DHS20C18_04200 [Saprospiraceae bacterium]|nr:MAG: hypothetical protein DHS20C18_04200 [Saprospiraceae bacterium]
MENLKETDFFNYSNPAIQEFVQKANQNLSTDLEKALNLYYLVRDDWKYNPYHITLEKEAWQASEMMKKREGHCLDKAILLITFARASGIPAKLHLAKVTNHIAVEKLIERLGTNILTPHGYAELFIDGKWVKATPAFNKELCEKLGVAPLDFDGKTDSIFQQFDKKGAKFMQYLEDYGTFSDVPFAFLINNMREHYPNLIDRIGDLKKVRL